MMVLFLAVGEDHGSDSVPIVLLGLAFVLQATHHHSRPRRDGRMRRAAAEAASGGVDRVPARRAVVDSADQLWRDTCNSK